MVCTVIIKKLIWKDATAPISAPERASAASA